MKNSAYSPRWAGMIQRYHATPTIRNQSVGEHTFQVMLAYVQEFGNPPPHVWFYMLYHDVAEIGTGDVPFLVKRRFPNLKLELNKAEPEILADFGVPVMLLTEKEERRIKWADLMEMKRFALEELAMGNTYAQDIVFNIDEALKLLGEVT